MPLAHCLLVNTPGSGFQDAPGEVRVCWFKRLTLAVTTVVLVGCEGSSSEPPAPELFADPAVCDVPCEVVLDSGIVDAGDKSLTFTWDVGGGPTPGDLRLLHTFETAGTYEVSVTVSDGTQATTDRVTVLAEPQPKTSATVDGSGGVVSLGAAKVTVPADVAPEAVIVELTQLPSMQMDADRVLRVGQFTALDSAYQVSTPLKTATAIDIAVTDSEAVGKDPADLAWLVRWVAQPITRDGPSESTSRASLADYGLVPVSRVDEDGTVHGKIFGRQRFQLVTLAEPMHIASFEIDVAVPATESSIESGVTAKALTLPLVVIMDFNEIPDIGSEAYEAVVKEGVEKSHEVLVTKKGFTGPQGILTVVVGWMKSPRFNGLVLTYDHQTIRLNYEMNDSDKIQKIVAHEFFHLIQHLNSNQVSLALQNRQRDAWFMEGTAEWAGDEVFDESFDFYNATEWRRFEVPLNQEGYGDSNEYETVGFWKWAESETPNILLHTIEDRRALTHEPTADGQVSIVENDTVTNYLPSFKKLWPDVDFMEYTYAARYSKDFDTDEINEGELWWTDPYLGPPKKVYVDPSKEGVIEAGVAGDSEDNPLAMTFNLTQHLTADVLKIGSPNLEGALHLRFPNTPNAPLQARALMLDRATGDVEDVSLIDDLQYGPEDVVFASFNSDKEAVILIVDPRWEYDADDTPITGEIEAWIEDPCGSIPGSAIEVSTTEDLIAAAKNPGAVIQLAPGTYDPPVGSWETPEYGPFMANLLLRNVTLIGAGRGATTIELAGGDFAALYTYNDATLRNLTVDALPGSQVAALDHRNVTICDVDFNFSSSHAWGIILNPWHGGSTSIGLHNSTLSHPLGGTLGTGLFLQTCSSPEVVNLNAVIRESQISGWNEGVLYNTGYGSCGSVSVSTDCNGFSNNTWNVKEANCPAEGQPCVAIERCP
jgi:PKD repeat protein